MGIQLTRYAVMLGWDPFFNSLLNTSAFGHVCHRFPLHEMCTNLARFHGHLPPFLASLLQHLVYM